MSLFASLLVVIAALICVSARTSWKDLSSYNFEKYVKEFGSPLGELKSDSAEWTSRKQIFDKELDRIRAHNANSAMSWKEGVNQFTAMTPSELKVGSFVHISLLMFHFESILLLLFVTYTGL